MADKQKQTQHWKSRAKTALAAIERRLAARPVLFTVCVLSICALVIVLRRPDVFTHAQFWAEDGVLWFQDAYNKGLWATLFTPYSGTIYVLLRVVGYASTIVPLAYAPLFFSVVAVLCQLLPVLILTSSRMRSIVKYRTVALAICLIYVCITNSSEVFASLTNMQWHFGIAAFMLLVAAKPLSKAWVVFDITVLALVGLDGPMTFLLTVIAFLIWLTRFRSKDRSAFLHLAVLAATSLVQAVSMLVIEPAQRGGGYVIDWADMARMVSGQILTGSIFGAKHVDFFYQSNMLYVVLVAGLSIIAYAVWKGPSWLKYANLYAVMLFIAMLASLKPLKDVDVWGILTHHDTGQRYWYVPIFIWLATLLWIVLAARNRFMRVICGCLLVLFVCIGVPGSWNIAPMPEHNYKYYANKFNALKKGKSYSIPINPEPWKVNLRKH